MRTLVAITVAVMASAAALAGDAAPAPASKPKVVHLDGAASLAALAQTNPNHAARAERILAAAGQLCKPGPEKVDYAGFQADNIRCEGAILRTSNPPKREIGFTLDETRYVALVTVPVDGTIRLLDAPAHRHVPPR